MIPVLHQINDVRLNMYRCWKCVCIHNINLQEAVTRIRIAGLRNENKTAKDIVGCFCSQTCMIAILSVYPSKEKCTVLCNSKSSLMILIKSMTFDHTKLTLDDLSCKITCQNKSFSWDWKL